MQSNIKDQILDSIKQEDEKREAKTKLDCLDERTKAFVASFLGKSKKLTE